MSQSDGLNLIEQAEYPQNQIPLGSVDILGVSVHCVDLDGILEYVRCACRQAAPRTILYANAHCLNLAWEDEALRGLLNRADLIITDGISVVWSGRLLGGCRLTKITGSDWLEGFCDLAEGERLRVFIVAGAPGIAARAVDNLLARRPRLRIVGARDGYFHARDEAALFAEIRAAGPDVLIVGMGTPKQEKWIARVQAEVGVPVCWAVGATIDYVAGIERRAPHWLNALGLEWLWRLWLDPLGKWRRYLVGNPLFVLRVVRQRLGF